MDRLTPAAWRESPSMEDDPNGAYVAYSDVEPILKALDTVLPRWRELHADEVKAAVAAIMSLGVRAGTYTPEGKKFEPGTRVYATSRAGFHVGAKGTVQYHAPDDKVWVLRDGATKAVWYSPYELARLPDKEAPCNEVTLSASADPCVLPLADACITVANGDCINPGCDLHKPKPTC